MPDYGTFTVLLFVESILLICKSWQYPTEASFPFIAAKPNSLGLSLRSQNARILIPRIKRIQELSGL